VRIVADPRRGVRMLHAEFDAEVKAPSLTLSSQVMTRNRSVDWGRKNAAHEDPAVLRANLQPSELKPLDGIVRKTALDATRGARSDEAKARALYDWVVVNAHREPSTRGCGTGDIKTMLETGNLGGKCADLNALFVGLCRSVGVPARDVYGLRLAPSAFGYKSLGTKDETITKAQHCRAEIHLGGFGWVATDPADVRKVMLEEEKGGLAADNPRVAAVREKLFGAWEGNWIAFNDGSDIDLPDSRASELGFLMYPQAEVAGRRLDCLEPDKFRYVMTAREIAA